MRRRGIQGPEPVGGGQSVAAASAVSDETFDASVRPPAGPLQTSLAFDASPVPADMLGRNRTRLTREDSETTRWFTRVLTDLVAKLAEHLVRRFDQVRRGDAGTDVTSITGGHFAEWCRQSLMPSPRQIVARVRAAAGEPRPAEAIGAALREIGFVGPAAAQAADAFAALTRGGKPLESTDDALWALLRDAVAKFAAQTAHVVLARVLLYRVGEDKGLYERILSGKPLGDTFDRAATRPGVLRTRPAIELALKIRARMEEFLPTVYLLGPFDWWLVLEHKAPSGNPEAKARLGPLEDEMEILFHRIFDELDAFELSAVDFDVWQTIYQHYLPEDERQRLGGFYTPQELVELVLDAAGFEASHEGLCRCTFVDPASGSGAFVVAAMRRLLAHLELDMPCHAELHARGVAPWARAEKIARVAAGAAHAVDIHPFAAFLTTMNVLFQVLPYYVAARRANPEFAVSLAVFAADSLELPEAQVPTPEQAAALNSRIRQAEDSARRYRETMSGRTFDLVVGNPPWGGVLKGPLAPIFDEARKARLRERYPASTAGKFDVYAPFLEHALQLLRDGGRVAFVTQGSYLDKSWAESLRAKLSAECCLECIIDMNPFGQLLFGAMNIPCVTVVRRAPPGRGQVHVVVCGPPAALRALPEHERRARLMDDARAALRPLSRATSSRVGVARGYRIARQELLRIGGGRWPVGEPPSEAVTAVESYEGSRLLDFIEPSQGVTPGGALDIFLMRSEDAERLKLGEALVRRALKSRELGKWRAEWSGRVLLYPYRLPRPGSPLGAPGIPAFRLDAKARAGLPLEDALDFDTAADDRERTLPREHGMTDRARREMLDHRIALGLVDFPDVARYLIGHYDRLSGRTFKKRNIRQFNRRWYEYLWPRAASVMLQRPRLMCPGLAKHVRFVLDEQGLLSDHAAFLLLPTERTASAFDSLQLTLTAVADRTITKADVFRYFLAFANSFVADALLRHARRPRPGDVYKYDEAFLREIPVPDPFAHKSVVRELLDLVGELTRGTAADVAETEGKVDDIVRRILVPGAEPAPGRTRPAGKKAGGKRKAK
ncbi:MAG: N-6 DNA methylase [Deltaproteobacteria bacterium]|nr:N-6 DNA methylase [Deltaproteobacteria bacterium]